MQSEVSKEMIKNTYVKTKVVATIGPASSSYEVLHDLIMAGVDVFRLNFSHGTHEGHTEVIENIRKASAELNCPVAVMQDLCGPKMRITSMVDDKNIEINTGDKIKVAYGDTLSSSEALYLTITDPAQSLQAGERVLLHDGIIELIVDEVKDGAVYCTSNSSGEIRSHAGIAFPDSNIDLPAITEKDLKDLEWGIQHQVDYVAVSFVQNASDITRLRTRTNAAGIDIRFIPKIERRVALEHIDEILDVSDGLMIARGDLGVEIPVETIPGVQRMLINEGNKRGIPVIVATEMLQSMITENRPTRAEVTDITFAVDSGADAVMLSGETAMGKHPVTCVNYMCSIAYEIEKYANTHKHEFPKTEHEMTTVEEAVASAAVNAASKVNAALLIAPTNSGETARLLAKYRPEQVISALSNNNRSLQRMALYRGVRPIFCDESTDISMPLDGVLSRLQKENNIPNGTAAVITNGLTQKSGTSIMEIRYLNYNK